MKLIDKDEILRDTARYKCVGDVLKAVEQATVFAPPPTPPNEPLTLEELREMDGEPVWIEEGQYKHWALIYGNGEMPNGDACIWVHTMIEITKPMKFLDYGVTWLAYRRKPQEGTI